MDEEEEFLKQLKELTNSVKDMPKMKEIQIKVNKILEKALEEINGYLIDEKDKMNSQMSKDSIEDLIKKNYIQLVRIKEENRKWEENLNL